MDHITWDYEEVYYQFYPVSDKAEELLERVSICVTCPETQENNIIIDNMADHLDKFIKSSLLIKK